MVIPCIQAAEIATIKTSLAVQDERHSNFQRTLDKIDSTIEKVSEKLDAYSQQTALNTVNTKQTQKGFGTLALLLSNFVSAAVVGIIVKVF